jgi:hypothetical protein
MALKKLVPTLDDLPEAIREHYTPVDENDEGAGYQLALDGASEKSQIKEFRSNNISLMKKMEAQSQQIEQLQQQYKGINPERYSKAISALEKIENDEDRKLVEQGEWEKVLDRRTSTMRSKFDEQLQAKTQSYNDLENNFKRLQSSHSQLQVTQQLNNAIASCGVKVRPAALQDITARTNSMFTLNSEGQLIAQDGSGHQAFGAKGDPLTMNEYVADLTQSAPHLFESAGGGSAKGASTPAGKRVIRPDQIGQYAAQVKSGEVIVKRD